MDLKPVSINRTAISAAVESRDSHLMVIEPSNVNTPNDDILEAEVIESSSSKQKEKPKPFIEANTEAVTLKHLRDDCIIPVFRDNEKTISHFEFIDSVNFVVNQCFRNETILEPDIRVSHKINGRIPSALNKKVSELED